LIPDDTFTPEELTNLTLKDLPLLFKGPRPRSLREARGIIPSKTNSPITDPE